MKLDGAVALVTGASSGIGEDVAIQLAKKGARVWATARSEDALRAVAARQSGIEVFPADITDEAARGALVEAAGPVDVLVNNAGIGWNGLVEDMPASAVRQLYEVNVLALIDLTQRVLPGMLERKRGHIVNIASVASFVATPPLTVYSSTKFAVQGFTDGLRRELLGRGVAVTSINPGPVATRFFARADEGDRPTDQMGNDRNPGVPVSMVTSEVLRAIQVNGLPPYDIVTVPRALGTSRLSGWPGASQMLDAVSVVSRRFARRQ